MYAIMSLAYFEAALARSRATSIPSSQARKRSSHSAGEIVLTAQSMRFSRLACKITNINILSNCATKVLAAEMKIKKIRARFDNDFES